MVIIFCEKKKQTIIVSYELRNKLAPWTVPSPKAKDCQYCLAGLPIMTTPLGVFWCSSAIRSTLSNTTRIS